MLTQKQISALEDTGRKGLENLTQIDRSYESITFHVSKSRSKSGQRATLGVDENSCVWHGPFGHLSKTERAAFQTTYNAMFRMIEEWLGR